MDSVWIFLSTAAGGAVAALLYVVLGGSGVHRQLRQRVDAVDSELEAVREMIIREIKRRASLAAQEAKRDSKDMAQLKEEAERRLATGTDNLRPVPGGFPRRS